MKHFVSPRLLEGLNGGRGGGGGRGSHAVCLLKFIRHLKGPLQYLLMPLLGKNQLAITLHMYA